MLIKEIEAAYEAAIANALEDWDQNSCCGETLPSEYGKDLLGISTGELFTPSSEVTDMHQRLLEIGNNSEKLDVIPYASMHFTFLALAPHKYKSVDQLPSEIDTLRQIYHQEISGFEFVVRNLRLVAVKNGLLLAGIPDRVSLERRSAFANKLPESEWATHLRSRYSQRRIPPVFWHATLARCESEFAPTEIRQLFHELCRKKYDAVNLGCPRLVATTYNWSRVLDIC